MPWIVAKNMKSSRMIVVEKFEGENAKIYSFGSESEAGRRLLLGIPKSKKDLFDSVGFLSFYVTTQLFQIIEGENGSNMIAEISAKDIPFEQKGTASGS